MIWTLVAFACTTPDDTGGVDCPGGGDSPTAVIGYGVGSSFEPYEDGAQVALTAAPQGGWGVPVRVWTTGLAADTDGEPKAPMMVLLETRLDGVMSAKFLNEESVAFCQGPDEALVWDLVVGFDAQAYKAVDDLILLHGAEAELVVEATDTAGLKASDSVFVEIVVE
jgi:hypothetical protein